MDRFAGLLSSRSPDSDPEKKSSDIRQPLLSRTPPFTLWQAMKEQSQFAIFFAFSYLFGSFLAPLLQSFFLNDGTEIQKKAFGLIETFLNLIMTTCYATVTSIQITLSDKIRFVNQLKETLSEIQEEIKLPTQDSSHSISDNTQLLNRLLRRLKNLYDQNDHEHKNESSGDDKNINSLIEALITQLKKTKEQSEEVLRMQRGMTSTEVVTTDHNPIWSEFLLSLEQQGALTDKVKEIHDNILAASNQHVGLTIRGAMLYPHTLLTLIVPGILSLGEILLRTGVDPAEVNEVRSFFMMILWGTPALVGHIGIRETLNATKNQRLAMFAVLLGLLNAIINGISGAATFYGWPALNIPSFGTAGLGASFSAGAWLTFIAGLTILWKHPFFKDFNLWSTQGGNFWHQFKDIFKKASQIFGMAFPDYALLAVVMTLASRYAAEHDVPANVAQGILHLYLIMFFIPFLSLFDSTINHCIRARDNPQEFLTHVKAGVLLQLLVGTAGTIPLLIAPEQLFKLFCFEECSSAQVDYFKKIAPYGALALILDAGVLSLKAVYAAMNELFRSMKFSLIFLMTGMILELGVALPNDLSPEMINLFRAITIFTSLAAHGYYVRPLLEQTLESLRGQNDENILNSADSPADSRIEIVEDNDWEEWEEPTCWSRVRHRTGTFLGNVCTFFNRSLSPQQDPQSLSLLEERSDTNNHSRRY